MRAPEVLLLDDGELDDIATLLADLEAPFERLRGGELRAGIPTPGVLLIATPRRLGSLAESPGPQRTPLRVVVTEGDSEGQRAQLRRIGFDFLVRRPVHPEALRLLLLRCLFSGNEQRADARVAVGYPVSIRSGLMPKDATLIDLSVGGCRLIAGAHIPVGRRLRVQLPRHASTEGTSTLAGLVARVDEDRGMDSLRCWRLGIAFEALNDAERADLERCVTEHARGPARMQDRTDPTDRGRERRAGVHLLEVKLDVDPEPTQGLEAPEEEPTRPGAEQRESARVRFAQRVPAYGKSALRVLMGRDLSTRGMRIEPHIGLKLGDRIHLAIYGDPEEAPALVWATIRRDDGDSGLAAHFDPLPAELENMLERWVGRLPLIESLQAGESQSLGAVLSEILAR